MQTTSLPWKSVGHLLEAASSVHKDKPLFIFEKQRLSFIEVNRRVNQTANALKKIGIAKGDKVSVMLPNGFEYPIIWLSLAKLGAITVPTNTNYQAHDLEYILTNSEACCMVIHDDYLPVLETVRDKLPGLKDVIVLGKTAADDHSFKKLYSQGSEEFEIKDIGENDLINIQYTSGTTGFPKGCMMTHAYLMKVTCTPFRYLNIEPEDVDLTAQPFYYVDPQWNVILCLMGGIPLVIMPKFSVSKFWPTVIEHNVTFFYMLGVMPNLLIKREPDELEKNHNVRIAICSGIVPQLHETLETRFNCPWREAYGLTESGFDVFVPIEDTDCVGSGAVGKSINPNTQVRIVDRHGNEVPDGDWGELVLRSESTMLGYWKNPEATNEMFRDGWCHTGDLAYKDEKGYFHLVGRIKDMVRRSAENISTAEVEGVLAEHEKIQLSAVVPVPDPIRGEEVKAYVVLSKGETQETVPPENIVEFAKNKLARFKIPRYIEYVDNLPRTPSERVEKHKLISAKDDLRLDSYDAEKNIWITKSILSQFES